MRVTDRDKRVIKFLGDNNNVVASTQAIAKMFYCESHNLNSSITIANRRLTKLYQGQYIQKVPRKFGEQQLWYIGNKPNQSQVRHKTIMTNFLGELVYQNYELLDIKFEHSLPEKYSIRMDECLLIKFNGQIVYLFVEVDLSHSLSTNYVQLIEDINNGLFRTKYPIIFVSISDFSISDETLKKNFVQIDTDLNNIVKLSWKFIK